MTPDVDRLMAETRARMLAHWVAPEPDAATMDLAEASMLVDKFRAARDRHLGAEVAPASELPCPKPHLLAAIMRTATAMHDGGRPDAEVRDVAYLTVDVQSFLPDDQVQALQRVGTSSDSIENDLRAAQIRETVKDARAYQLTWLVGSDNPFAAKIAVDSQPGLHIGATAAEVQTLGSHNDEEAVQILEMLLAIVSAEVGSVAGWWSGGRDPRTLLTLLFFIAPLGGVVIYAGAGMLGAVVLQALSRSTGARFDRAADTVDLAALAVAAVALPAVLLFVVVHALT